jgi:predicted transcriptional regulator
MELNLKPESVTTLNDLAASTGRGIDELIDEAVGHLAAYNEWFGRKVDEGLEALERGDVVSHEDVRAWLENRGRPRTNAG